MKCTDAAFEVEGVAVRRTQSAASNKAHEESYDEDPRKS